jgi:hydrogenase expression/formation protein HypC
MCLGVPGRILSIEANGLLATVDFFGVRRVVRLELIDQPVVPGDYVLNHVGYAIRRIPEDDIEGTLALYEQLVRDASDSGNDDLMAADVRGELQATSGGGGDEPAGS